MAGRSASPLAIALGTFPFLSAAIYQAWDLTLWIVRNRENESDSSY